MIYKIIGTIAFFIILIYAFKMNKSSFHLKDIEESKISKYIIYEKIFKIFQGIFLLILNFRVLSYGKIITMMCILYSIYGLIGLIYFSPKS